jgi:hypothetical protein
MTAHATTDLLSALLDGELAGPERRRVADHLAACPACRARFDALGRVVASLRRLERAAPPPALALDVQRRIALAPAARADRLARLEERLKALGAGSTFATTFAVVLALAAMLYLFSAGLERRARHPTAVHVVDPETSAAVAAGLAARDPQTAEAGGRTFERQEGGWIEVALLRETARTGLVVDRVVDAASPEGRDLLARHPGLAALPAEPARVVLRDGERVIALRRPSP